MSIHALVGGQGIDPVEGVKQVHFRGSLSNSRALHPLAQNPRAAFWLKTPQETPEKIEALLCSKSVDLISLNLGPFPISVPLGLRQIKEEKLSKSP